MDFYANRGRHLVGCTYDWKNKDKLQIKIKQLRANTPSNETIYEIEKETRITLLNFEPYKQKRKNREQV